MSSDGEWSDSYLHLGEAVDDLKVTASKPRFSCLCGHTFRKVEDMYEHAEEADHLVKCGCGELYGTHKALLMHQREVQHDHVLSHTKLEASYDQLSGELNVATRSELSIQRPADTPAFICFCGEEFDFVQELYEHATEEGHRLKCGCGHFCGSRKLMFQHQNGTVHEQKKSVTTLEAVKGLPGGNLALPAITHASDEYLMPSKCNMCPGTKFRNAAALEQHNKDKHPSIAAPTHGVFTCRHCRNYRPMNFATARQLREHGTEQHPSCPVCYIEFLDIFKEEHKLRTAADVAIPCSSAQTQVFQHQRATMHCYCAKHDMAFCSTELYNKHCIQHNEEVHKNTRDCLREDGYISRRRAYGYECKSRDQSSQAIDGEVLFVSGSGASEAAAAVHSSPGHDQKLQYKAKHCAGTAPLRLMETLQIGLVDGQHGVRIAMYNASSIPSFGGPVEHQVLLHGNQARHRQNWYESWRPDALPLQRSHFRPLSSFISQKARKMSDNQDSQPLLEQKEKFDRLEISPSNQETNTRTAEVTTSAYEAVKGQHINCYDEAFHGGEVPSEHLTCHLCPDNTFAIEFQLQTNKQASHHTVADPSQEPLTCKFCPDKTSTKIADLQDHHFEIHRSCPICSQVFRDNLFGKYQFRSAHEYCGRHQVLEKHGFCADHQVACHTLVAWEEHCAAHNAPGHYDSHYLASLAADALPEQSERAGCPSCSKIFLGQWEQHGPFSTAGAKDPMEVAVLVRSAQAALEAHQVEIGH